MSTFENVSIVKRANIYFDGKCVSHTIQFEDGSKKTVGVILPSSLVFNTGSPEVMETVSGSCKVRMNGETDWSSYTAGQSFEVPGNSSFEISCDEPYHYVCHLG